MRLKGGISKSDGGSTTLECGLAMLVDDMLSDHVWDTPR
jgi:hypothetical protein